MTPFCSCSAVPLFVGFVEAGVPLGVTFSFLIAAPMINEVAVVLLLGLFGWKTALLYVGTGLSIAITAGYIIGRLRVERFVEDWVYQIRANAEIPEETVPSFRERVQSGYEGVKEIVGKVWPYLLVGIGVGAGIHGYVPENFMASLMGKSAWWSVPVSVLIGIPLYSNAAGIIPIVQALLEKGASLGTVLALYDERHRSIVAGNNNSQKSFKDTTNRCVCRSRCNRYHYSWVSIQFHFCIKRWNNGHDYKKTFIS